MASKFQRGATASSAPPASRSAPAWHSSPRPRRRIAVDDAVVGVVVVGRRAPHALDVRVGPERGRHRQRLRAFWTASRTSPPPRRASGGGGAGEVGADGARRAAGCAPTTAARRHRVGRMATRRRRRRRRCPSTEARGGVAARPGPRAAAKRPAPSVCTSAQRRRASSASALPSSNRCSKTARRSEVASTARRAPRHDARRRAPRAPASATSAVEPAPAVGRSHFSTGSAWTERSRSARGLMRATRTTRAVLQHGPLPRRRRRAAEMTTSSLEVCVLSMSLLAERPPRLPSPKPVGRRRPLRTPREGFPAAPVCGLHDDARHATFCRRATGSARSSKRLTSGANRSAICSAAVAPAASPIASGDSSRGSPGPGAASAPTPGTTSTSTARAPRSRRPAAGKKRQEKRWSRTRRPARTTR